MLDERDMNHENKWHYECIAKKCLGALDKNNIGGYYCQDREEALRKISQSIPPTATIGVGDSVTLLQVGIVQELERRETHEIFNPFRKSKESCSPPTFREIVDVGKKAATAEFFLTGMNAITMDGKLVNTDGLGNRVAPLIFGPRRVIVVAGINKITGDLGEALHRIKEIAAPINAKRHQLKHGMEGPPCSINGICCDCHTQRRICCYTVIVEAQHHRRIEVVLVGESLGI